MDPALERGGNEPEMRTRHLPEHGVETDESGFLVDGLAWTPEIAEAMARAAGLAGLTPRHWRVVLCCRETAVRDGLPPDLPAIAQRTGLSFAELDQLFLHRPLELLTQLAGLSKPADPNDVS